MLLNLRAMPHGLESHREFLRTEVEAWLTGAAEETDVTFICTGVDTEERSQAVRLAAHQVRPNIFTPYDQIFSIFTNLLRLAAGGAGPGVGGAAGDVRASQLQPREEHDQHLHRL